MKQTVSQRIKKVREDLSLTQGDLAAIAGVTVTQLSRIENGKSDPQISTLNDIAKATGVTVEWLSDGKGEYSPVVKSAAKESAFDPARDTLYKELREQIVFYRSLLTQMAGGKATSFLQALSGTGLLKKRSLRAAA